MFREFFIGLMNNAVLLLALGVIYNSVPILRREKKKLLVDVLVGLGLGVVTIAVMLNTVPYSPGLVFDTRSIVLSLAGLFFGSIPTLIAGFMAILYRAWQGGVGAPTGVGVITCSVLLGIGWRTLRGRWFSRYRWWELYLFGIVVHFVMLLWMLILPWPQPLTVLANISLPIMVIYPITTILLGKLLGVQAERNRDEDLLRQKEKALRESEERFAAFMDNLPMWAFIKDRDGRLLYTNQEMRRLFTIQAEDNRDPLQFLPQDLLDLSQFVSETKFQQRQVELFTASGEKRWFETRNFAIKIKEQPDLIGYLGMDITARRSLEEMEYRANHQMFLLYDASRRLNSTLELDEIYKTVHQFVHESIPCDSLFVSSFDPASQMITCRAAWIDNKRQDASVFPPIPLEPEGRGTQSIAIRSGRSLLIRDFQAWAKTASTIVYISDEGEVVDEVPPDADVTRSGLVVPLKVGGQVSGVIQVLSCKLDDFNEDQLKLLESLSLHISHAQQNALLYKKVQEELHERLTVQNSLLRTNERLNTLREIDKIILQNRSAKLTAEQVVFYARQLIPCERAGVMLFYPEKNELQILVDQADFGPVWPEGVTLPADPRFLFYIKQGPTLLTEDARLVTAPTDPLYQIVKSGIVSFLHAPLLIQGQLLGTLSLGADTASYFSEEHREILAEIATLLAISIRQINLNEQVEHHTQELEERVQERTAALEFANQELEAFVYSVSHDLRAPLRTVSGFSQLLKDDFKTRLGETGLNYVERVFESSQRMNKLIDDLMRLSRVSRTELLLEKVNLKEIADQIIGELKSAQPERKVTFINQVLVATQADKNLIQIVLENLLRNAWKFTSKKPSAEITFGCQVMQGEVIFFVRDDGVGFDNAQAKKLFGAFQRLHSSRDFEGTGIGLVIVQRIIQRHGGMVWAEGSPGQGACFYFTLPGTEKVF
jgi:PAS domain S-box-containing protein